MQYLKATTFSTLLFLFLATSAFTQSLDLLTVYTHDEPFEWEYDSQRNLYKVSSFEDTISVQGSLYFANGEADLLVEKLDPQGNLLMTQQLSSAYGNTLSDMDMNAQDELVIMGSYKDSINISLDGGELWVSASDSTSRFISSYAADLSAKWVATISAVDGPIHRETVVALEDGSVIAAGGYIDSMSLIIGTDTMIYQAVGPQTYLIKFNSQGGQDYAITEDLFGDEFGFQRDISVSGEEIILSMSSLQEASLAKIDIDSGNILWEHVFFMTIHEHINDQDGNIYVTGNFDEFIPADFDPGPEEVNLTANSLDVFLLKLSSAGDFIWVKNIITGENIDTGTAITIGDDNQLYLTGCIQRDGDFDPT